MNKKFKMTIPFAVLALTCGIAAGCGGCAPAEGHTHDYTQWAHDDNQHWKVCPDDNEVDESSKEDHLFVAGECECGATEQPGPVVEEKYGTVTGKVKLYKQGAYATDLTGIKVDMGNDDVEIDGSVADGAYQFTVTNVKVGAIYNLTITKTGYKPYSTEIELEEEGEEAKIGGTNGVTLQYEVFGLLCGWDGEYHDFSHANDEDPYITYLESDGSKTFDVLTKDSYNDVSASLKVEYGNSLHNWHTQGIVLKFEDGKHVIVRYHNGDQVNGNIQYVDNAWDVCPKENTLFGDDAQLNEWGEAPIHTLLNEETAAIKAGGLDLNVILKDGTLYTFFGGKFIGKYTLPAGYADKKVQVGYFAYNPANNVQFKYGISSEVPATMSTALEINVTQPQDVTGCTVTATPQKDSYEFGEQIELTFTAEEGYKLDALTVGGEDKLNAVANGKLTITADRPALAVEATFVAEEPIPLDLTVKGKKLGTTAALAAGTTVAFKGTDYSFTVGADGKIESDSVIKGRYIVVVDGYFEQEIVFDETLTEITLEYDLMENLTLAWNWGDNANLGEQNDGKLTQVSGATQWVSSKDSYDSVAITATLVSGGGRQGVFIRFKGDSYANDKYVMIQKERDDKVSWNGENNIWGNGSNLCGDTWTDYVNPLTEEDLAKIAAGEYELTLVRDKNKIYVFINGTYYDTKILDESYADMQCYVGVYCTDTPSGAQRSFKIEDVSEYLSAVTITDGTAEDAHGSLSGIPEEAVKPGETVTLTIVADEGYKLSALKVNGTDVTAQVTGTTYTFVVSGDTTVVAEFTQIVPGSINAAVSGTKLGVTEAFAEGTQVTLTCQGLEDITAELTATGLSITSIPAGVWTVNVQGYFPVQITVENETEYSQAIALEYDMFKIIRWDEAGHGFDHVNDETPYVEWISNDVHSLNTVSKECWLDDATVSVTIKKSLTTNNNNEQGLILSFEDGKAAILNLNTDGTPRLQFRPNLFDNIQTAFTTEWVEFKNVTADELAKYNTDTGIVLKIARQGNLLHIFIDDTYHGTATLPETYKTSKMGIGVYSFDAVYGAKWYFEVSDTLPNLTVTLTDGTAEDAHGSLSGIPEEAVKLGETVTLTIAADEGYKFSALKVNGTDVTAQVTGTTYTFVVSGDTTVVAEFTQIVPGSINAAVSGTKLGVTEAFAEGTQVTLTCQGLEDITAELTATGLSISSIPAGVWTVNVQGYLPVQITVENETEYSQAITLEYDTFKDILGWGQFDFSKQNAEHPEIAITNNCSAILTNDTYDAVMATIYLKGEQMSANNNAGIIFRFVSDGMSDVVVVRMEEGKKVQFEMTDLWNSLTTKHNSVMATGSEYKDLIFFTGDNADAKSAEYLEAYNSGTLKLSVVRKGATFYVFLGDRYIGQKTFDAKYENAKCEVGFVSENLDNATEWKRWKVEISNELPDLSVTVNKAEMQNGSVTVSENITLGSTVTITVSPAEGYMLGDIKVEGVTLTAGSNNTYTFVATEKSYTVTATFIEVPAVEAETTVTGIGLGAASVDMNGKEITFTANGTETKYTVTDGKVKGVLAAGEYTVSCEGFYDLTATVEEDGSFAGGTALAFEKIIFAYNLINEPESNLNNKPNVGDSTAAASDGIIKATADGRIYEWSTEQYKDVAVTVTLKSGNGNQGLVMRFNNKQQDVRVRFENTKAQWIGGDNGGWWWGTSCIIDKWDFGNGTDYANPMNEALLAKYNGEGLNLTLVRKGSMVYALVDGTFYSAQIIPYETSDVRLCLFVEDAKSGYEIPFEVSTDVDAILNAAVDTHNVLGVVGNWTVTDKTLSVNGNGYAEIAPMMDVQTKESLTIKISSSNATKQGLTYRFADGKWFGFRYEPSYIQYTEDIIIFGAAGSRLKGWTTIYNLSEEEKTAFSGDGIELQLVRDGKCIYVMLGGNVIDKVIMGDEYATMDGVAAVTVEGGTGTAFAYEYKTGENVEVPKVYTVNASFDGAAHGYFTEVGKSLANEGDKVTVTITASENWWPDGVWTYFPTAIVVNGQEFALTTDDLTSIEANRCTYTYTIDGITADTTVKFKVTQLDCVKGLVKVSVDGEGGTAKSDSGEDGYHWNDGCDVEMTPAEGYEIESITITKGENGTPETITEGWAGPDANGVYKYTIPYGITEPTTIVVKFKATATQPTTPGDGDEGGDTTDASAE